MTVLDRIGRSNCERSYMKPLRATCRKKVDVRADNSEDKPHTRSFESAVGSRQATGLLDKPTRSRQAIPECGVNLPGASSQICEAGKLQDC
jgi:hypothetical protein